MKITGSTKGDGEDFLRVRAIDEDGNPEQSVNIEDAGAVQAHVEHAAATSRALQDNENAIQAANAQREADVAAANERHEATKAAIAEARDKVLAPLVHDAFARARSRDAAAKPFQDAQLEAEKALEGGA